MNLDFLIAENEITGILKARWIAVYYNYCDARVNRARDAFDNRNADRRRKIVEMLSHKEQPLTESAITETYNQLIAEEAEEVINIALENLKDDNGGEYDRAQAEIDIAETMLKIYDIFGTGNKEYQKSERQPPINSG